MAPNKDGEISMVLSMANRKGKQQEFKFKSHHYYWMPEVESRLII